MRGKTARQSHNGLHGDDPASAGLPLAYFSRGTSYSKKGEYDRAMADYTAAIQTKPDDAEAYWACVP